MGHPRAWQHKRMQSLLALHLTEDAGPIVKRGGERERGERERGERERERGGEMST